MRSNFKRNEFFLADDLTFASFLTTCFIQLLFDRIRSAVGVVSSAAKRNRRRQFIIKSLYKNIRNVLTTKKKKTASQRGRRAERSWRCTYVIKLEFGNCLTKEASGVCILSGLQFWLKDIYISTCGVSMNSTLNLWEYGEAYGWCCNR